MNLKPLMAPASVLLIISCGAARGGPEPIPLDRVNCARCGMLISSDANAAQSQAPGRPTQFFDDIGCLARAADTSNEGPRRYVRLVSSEWAAADTAWFARSATAKTPMDYGILAFATEAEARSADRDNQPHRWPAIVAAANTR